MVAYYENGQLLEEGTFKDGKREGPWGFYTKDSEEQLIPQNAKDGKNLEQGSGTYEDGNKISD